MDHRQLEAKLQEAYKKGVEDGARSGQQELRRQQERFLQAVSNSLAETKGIGAGRKELVLERLAFKLKEPSAHSKY